MCGVICGVFPSLRFFKKWQAAEDAEWSRFSFWDQLRVAARRRDRAFRSRALGVDTGKSMRQCIHGRGLNEEQYSGRANDDHRRLSSFILLEFMARALDRHYSGRYKQFYQPWRVIATVFHLPFFLFSRINVLLLNFTTDTSAAAEGLLLAKWIVVNFYVGLPPAKRPSVA